MILNLDLGLQGLLDSKTLGRTPHLNFLFVRTGIKLFLSLPFLKYYDTCHCKVLALIHLLYLLGPYIAFNFLHTSIYSRQPFLTRATPI